MEKLENIFFKNINLLISLVIFLGIAFIFVISNKVEYFLLFTGILNLVFYFVNKKYESNNK